MVSILETLGCRWCKSPKCPKATKVSKKFASKVSYEPFFNINSPLSLSCDPSNLSKIGFVVDFEKISSGTLWGSIDVSSPWLTFRLKAVGLAFAVIIHHGWYDATWLIIIIEGSGLIDWVAPSAYLKDLAISSSFFPSFQNEMNTYCQVDRNSADTKSLIRHNLCHSAKNY